MTEFGLFTYFGDFMETLSRATSTFSKTLGQAIGDPDSFVGSALEFLGIDLTSIPGDLLNTTLAAYLFGGALVGVLIWSIIKWIVPLI